MTDNLSPCPFCGSNPVPLSHLKSYEQSVADKWRCENLDCPIAGLTMTSSEWNTRATEAQVELLKAALAEADKRVVAEMEYANSLRNTAASLHAALRTARSVMSPSMSPQACALVDAALAGSTEESGDQAEPERIAQLCAHLDAYFTNEAWWLNGLPIPTTGATWRLVECADARKSYEALRGEIAMLRKALEELKSELAGSRYPYPSHFASMLEGIVDAALPAPAEARSDHLADVSKMIPGGWMLVPAEPTKGMLTVVHPSWRAELAANYRAMLAAVPAPPKAEAE